MGDTFFFFFETWMTLFILYSGDIFKLFDMKIDGCDFIINYFKIF